MFRELAAAAQQVDEIMASAFTAACSFQRLDVALVAPGTVQTIVFNSVTTAGGTAEEWSDGDLTGTERLREWLRTKSLFGFVVLQKTARCQKSCHLTAVQSRPRHQSREHSIQRHISNLAVDMASSGHCDFVLEIPWNSRAVRRISSCMGFSMCVGSAN